MKRYAGVIALVAALAAPAVAPASHDSSRVEVFKLKTKVKSLTSDLAEQGIRKRLARHEYKARTYSGKCKRLSRTRRRCTYKFRDALQHALGEGAYCSSKRGTTVKLVRKGKAISVGPTPTKRC